MPTRSVVKPAATSDPYTVPTSKLAGSILDTELLFTWKRQPEPVRDRMGCLAASLGPMAALLSYSLAAMATAVALTWGVGDSAAVKAAWERSEVSTLAAYFWDGVFQVRLP